MSRPFAAFDIDGTLLRWQLYHAVADELSKRGLLDDKSYRLVREARMTWKKRQHASSYQNYEAKLVEFFEQALKEISPRQFATASKAVINVYKDQVYRYTRDLIGDLKQKDYLLFAISASHQDIVAELASYYGFDDSGGSIYQISDNKFTGKNQILKSENKLDFLKQLVATHGAVWTRSIAVGDSEGDIAMLEAVEQPIAFNPTAELFQHAQKHGWPVVVERKNMIYNLTPDHGNYKLT